MKIVSKFFILALICFIISCNTNINNESINEEFYKSLFEQVNGEYFSPIEFAGKNSLKNIDVEWELKKEELNIHTSDGATVLKFSPIEIIYEQGTEEQRTSYSIIIFYKDGSIKTIKSLMNPIEQSSGIQFASNDKNINIVVQPGIEYVNWKIKPIDKSQIDSIVIKGDARGPYYGGGERYIGTNLDGRTISNQPNDHYWDPPKTESSPWGNPHEPGHYNKYEPTYLQLSFFLTPFGQAWLIDDAASVFMSFSEVGNQFSVRIESNQTEFYTINRKSSKEALKTYTSIAGRQPALEDWALGVWVCILDGQDSVYAKANRLIEWGIPAGVIWTYDMGDIESSQGYQNWTTGPYWDLKEMTDSLHSLGFKALSYLHPYQEPTLPKSTVYNPTYHKYKSLGVLLETPDSIRNSRYGHDINGLYNFHLPLMGDLWQQVLHNVVVRDGFDGYMEDFGDLSYCFDRELQVWKAIDYKQETPLTPNQFNNSFPLVYHKLSYLQAAEINPNLATFCRSGSIGSAAYTKIVWGGDQMSNWDKTFGYPTLISSGISCGLSGYASWAPDILSSSPDKELWKRWVQFAAFTPILRDHLWVNDPTSVDIWYDNETAQYFKKYAEIHMELVSYIQEALANYRKTGTPVVRHMMLEFPDDQETYTCEYQYMFGADYLVAPVVDKGHLSKNIYFPKGKWKSFWGKETIDSKGEWIEVEASLEEIPVYERL